MALLDKFFHVEKRRSLPLQVVDHLRRLLNTRCDYGAWQEGFGLQDYSGNLSAHQLAEKIAADMAQTIERYEKRVTVESIEPVSSEHDLTLRFRIYCKITGKPHKLAVAFENKKEQIIVEVDDE